MLSRQLLQKPHDWTLSDVEQLVAERLPEGQRIDYKAVLALDTKKQKAEVAKDVSGMANAQGGWLLFGVAEDESEEPRPTGITAFQVGDLLTRLENILDSALEPIPDYEAVSIDAEDHGAIVLVKVADAPGRPVMVQGYGQNRYFVRSGTRTRPMNAAEVARAHAFANLRSEHVLERLHDLPLISNPSPGFDPLPLDDMAATPVATVIIAAIDGPPELIGRNHIRGDAFPEIVDGYRGQRQLRRGGQWTINNFGLLDEVRDPPPQPTGRLPIAGWRQVEEDDNRLKRYRLAIYRSGVFEWARRYREQIPSQSLIDDVHDALLRGARVFDRIGYAGRLMTWVRIDHAEEAELGIANTLEIDPQKPGIATIDHSREVTSDELLADPMPTVREAMDAVWQAFGIDRCLLLTSTKAPTE